MSIPSCAALVQTVIHRGSHFYPSSSHCPASLRNRQLNAVANAVHLGRVDLLPRLGNLLQHRLEGQVRARRDGGGLVLEADFVGLDACDVLRSLAGQVRRVLR